jgi:hypothetical protein
MLERKSVVEQVDWRKNGEVRALFQDPSMHDDGNLVSCLEKHE